MAKIGVCAFPTMLTLEQILEFTRDLGIQAVTLYPKQLPFAPALKSEGYTVGCFLPWQRDIGADLSHVDYVFIGDEVNLDTHVHDRTPPEEYFYVAQETVRSLRERYSGEIVCASLGCIPPWYGFGKWFARVDTAYLERLRDLGAKEVFSAFACNPFHTPFPVVEREFKRVLGDSVRIYCAGFGYDNLAFDSKMLVRLGAWGRRKRQLQRCKNIVVAGIWCLATYEDGRWGMVEIRPRPSFAGARFGRLTPEKGKSE